MRPLATLEARLRRQVRSPSTVESYLRTARSFLAFVSKPASRVEPADVRRFLAARSSRVAAGTQAGDLVALRALYRALLAENPLGSDPTKGLRVKVPGSRPQLFLSPASVSRVLKVAPSPRHPSQGPAVALRDRALLELLYGTALRASEVRRILLVDLHLQEGSLTARRSKRGENRMLPLPPSSLPHLEAYVRDARPYLARHGRDEGRLLLTSRGMPLSASGLKRIVRSAARRAGIRATAHAFRRSAATDLVRGGASLEAVRQLLGHRRLSTTEIYLQVNPEDLRRAVALLDS
jgi:site-specific recombinase XerD